MLTRRAHCVLGRNAKKSWQSAERIFVPGSHRIKRIRATREGVAVTTRSTMHALLGRPAPSATTGAAPAEADGFARSAEQIL
jgi:hypothetical protein